MNNFTDYTTTSHQDDERYCTIFVRTATGTKIHGGSPNGSTTNCGVWLKVAGQRMAVRRDQVKPEHLCDSCFGPDHAARTVAQPVNEETLRAGQIKTALLLDEESRSLRGRIELLTMLWKMGPTIAAKKKAVDEAYDRRYGVGTCDNKLSAATSLGLRRKALKDAEDKAWDMYIDFPNDKAFAEYLDEVYADDDGILSLEGILKGAREYCGKLEVRLQDRTNELGA